MEGQPSQGTIGYRTLEIHWHWSRERAETIFSVDFHPTQLRLLTAGADCTVRVWDVKPDILLAVTLDHGLSAQHMSESCNHVSAICEDRGLTPNCARWSPSGFFIGVACDEGQITVLRQTSQAPLAAAEDDRKFNVEHWTQYRTFRHLEDLYDIAFSPKSKYVIVCGQQGGIAVYDLEHGVQSQALNDMHDKSCQGVSWDPWNLTVTSFGADRVLRFFDVHSKSSKPLSFRCSTGKKEDVCFRGIGYSPFFRRMSWSPDGLMLAVPLGTFPAEATAEKVDCAFVFLRDNFSTPAFAIGSKDTPIVGARFAPCAFERPQDTDGNQQATTWGPSEYYLALALWSEDSVFLFRTDCSARMASIGDFHFDRINDVAWNSNASILIAASQDGYATALTFRSVFDPVHSLFDVNSAMPLTRKIAEVISPLRQDSEAFERKLSERANAEASAPAQGRSRKKRKIEVDDEAPANIADAEVLGALLEADGLALDDIQPEPTGEQAEEQQTGAVIEGAAS